MTFEFSGRFTVVPSTTTGAFVIKIYCKIYVTTPPLKITNDRWRFTSTRLARGLSPQSLFSNEGATIIVCSRLTFFLNLLKVMLSTRPGLEESVLQAILEYECRLQGAQILAFPPVVAGGLSANTLHYIGNSHIIRLVSYHCGFCTASCRPVGHILHFRLLASLGKQW